MRAKRSFFNAFSGLFSQFVSVALGVIIPRLVLVQLGSEANGLLSATQQALVYLDLLESGIGTAALQALYKPAAEQDRAAVSGIFNAIRREYAKVGIAYAALVCGLSVLFPFFIKTELPFFTVLLTVLLGGMGQAVRFLFQAKYRVLLQAEGRGYVLINANLLLTVSISIGKIILLICGLSLIAVQLLCFLCGLLQTALLTLYAKKQYSWLNRAVPPDTTATAQHRAVLGESYVDNIAVFPEFRGHGVGRTLMAALIEKARENGGVFITLEVRTSNLPAIAMYRSLGFTEAGVRRNFYTEPREDALIFTLSF